MLDSNDLLVSVKQATVDAMSASKPTAITFGKVISVSPLKINVEQKMVLTSAQLVLTRNVTDYTVQMTVNHTTESALNVNTEHSHNLSGETEEGGTDLHTHSLSGTTESGGNNDLSHSHDYAGTKTFTVHNALKTGEEVIMIQMQGGQKYIVLDRLVGT